ncbi:Ig-like domain-containing protein [Bifidobacterium aerophilum]|uniref:Bacterial Ig-like domain-containing protein n=1 Tax=Bifidobacterium aerophilum TaxID=1798155 RepID=A0A6N9Z6D3_9BIFI|nr:hypothetical protein [Bifidobacterium aerophilum]
MSITVHVNPATQVSVENNGAVKVTTQVGRKPALPATLAVTWSNGDVTDETVAWDDYDASWIETSGTFTVSGKVGDFTVSATVTVTKTDTTKPGDNGKPTTKPGTNGNATKPGNGKPQAGNKATISSTGAAVLPVAIVVAVLVAVAIAVLAVKRRK